MAKRQDTGSNAAHQNQRPTPHNEDAVPEQTDNVQGRGDEADDEFDTDEAEDLGEDDEAEEGSF